MGVGKGIPTGGKEPDAVCLAYVHQNNYTASWADSREALIGYDLTHHGRLMRGGYINMRANTDGLPEARNKAVASFLAQDVPWLFWTDTDMGFQADALERLMRTADPVTHPIVGGLCFAMREVSRDGYNGHRTVPKPVIMDWLAPTEEEPATFTFRQWYPPDTVIKCAGTGSAFVLIHRTVLEKMQAEYGDSWYDRIRGDDGQMIGEDISFCVRAGVLGFPIHVDTGVKTTHMKTVWLGEDDYWQSSTAPPATDGVIVWTPADASPELRASLTASTGLAFRMEGDWDPEVHAPWVFVATGDTVFGPGWFDQAVLAAQAGGADVVGTSGGLLVRSSYIDAEGASWDGPGSLIHGGYETLAGGLSEIIEVATARERFVVSKASNVVVGSAPELSKRDRRLYEARSRKHGKAAA